MKKDQFVKYIKQEQFKELFIAEMGWNQFRGQAAWLPIDIEDNSFQIYSIAEKNGFQILICPVTQLPNITFCRKLDSKIRSGANDYICIFYIPGTQHHEWIAPIKLYDRREIVTIEYEKLDQIDFLYSKIDFLTFDLDEETTIVDVKDRVQNAFALNSENITKNFYVGFRKQHKLFSSFISGINDNLQDANNKNKQWYASIMLNRLMFCYFIQKKGFLNGDFNYLQNKLKWVQEQQGKNLFFKTFYKGFLSELFISGLNSSNHGDNFERIYGRIPYLNGGMFELHQLEKDYSNIDIKDEAFVNLFNFFDTWKWHLDTRVTSNGKDINPDVLGYIFEQYINDRAQMGAYYTKEDITEYISKNAILPSLFCKVKDLYPEAFSENGDVWLMLKHSNDRYLYDSLKRGYSKDWRTRIPAEISVGFDNKNLIVGRNRWNEKTPDLVGLPNEIWRETIKRFQQCDQLLSDIQTGKIKDINEFITRNLNITLFISDLVYRNKSPKFLQAFYKALRGLTILDPTCGSGAFLFAAMNVLEPLYEACINQMQKFNNDNNDLFKSQVEEINNKYRSNIQYFIYKNIILRNLHGVDIMVEAVEIAKLRLFLKMMAVVNVDFREKNLGLDPLPDIDFNILCGNSLVGYTSLNELNNDLELPNQFTQIWANDKFKDLLSIEINKVSSAYNSFLQVQLSHGDNLQEIKKEKLKLKKHLSYLNDLLNQLLFNASTSHNLDFDQWLSNYQPFHWFINYFLVMQNGGFDVIIGNPPYVEYQKKNKQGISVYDTYKITNYKTEDCGNLYAFILERCKVLLNEFGYIGMIVPLSGHSTERMKPLIHNFYDCYKFRTILNLSADANPQKLFEGVKFRLSIFFVSNFGSGQYSSKYTKWTADERKYLFTTHVSYCDSHTYSYNGLIGKVPDPIFLGITKKINKEKPYFFLYPGSHLCYYHNAPVHWIRAHSFIPYFKSERDGEGVTGQLKTISFRSSSEAKIASCILCSSLFFIWWIVNSDCYHLNKSEIASFRFSLNAKEQSTFGKLADMLSEDMLKKSKRRTYVYKTTGKVEFDEFYLKLSKPIIDQIDIALAKHYGFNEEELDFIINYDIKYRLGNDLLNDK